MENKSIVICGQEFDIGTRVVLWTESRGFNGYDRSKYITKVHNRKTGKTKKEIVSGARYSKRKLGKMTLEKLQKIVTQFFLHHSGLYRARDTFHVLHNQRRLSVHFILDDDGTIYQTLDLAEKAWHGGKNNLMSVGIEIDSRALASRFPNAYDESHQNKYKVGTRRKRMDKLHGRWIKGYEYSEKQYVALIKLAMVLKNVFPLMSVSGNVNFPCYNGKIIKSKISTAKQHRGFICHYNNSSSKIDPVSFDHTRLVLGVNENNPCQGSTFVVTTWKEKQKWLNNFGYNPGPIDGVFGSKTKKAIQDFQLDNGLSPDGEWGLKTDYMMDLKIKDWS